MAENSSIEWCDHTFNPWYGCTKVSPGCDHCYAEARMDTRLHRVQWGAGQPRVRTKDWSDPKRWNSRHEAFYAANGRRQRVFCASLADVFDNQVPLSWRSDLFDLIDSTPNLDWLLLTKRIGNVAGMLRDIGPRTIQHGAAFEVRTELPANVWLGATVVNQEEADRDIPKLLATPARVRFLSMEPLLGDVDLSEWLFPFEPCKNCPCPNPDVSREGLDECCKDPELMPSQLHWVIVGGESGHGARPMRPDWARSLRDQCAAAGVPFLFKQWGEWWPHDQGQWITPAERHVHPDDEGDFHRIGKKAAGRLLDGVEHNGFPEVQR